jgi:heterodisulfide reductase subunit B
MEKKIPRYVTKIYRPSEHELLMIKINNNKRRYEIEYTDFNRECGFTMSSHTKTDSLKSIYEQLTRKEDKVHTSCNFKKEFVDMIMIDIHNKIVVSR